MLNHVKIDGDTPIIGNDNLYGLYSFHPVGAQVALADGAVKFLQDSIEPKAMFALITREGGDM